MDKIKEIISKMTLEDKIRLCSGASFWETEQMEQYGIPSFFMSDGPHGLRVQKGEADHLGINQSEKATCFPTASASAASWNPQLLKEMGEAIGEEALHYGVDVVLGPGVCIKRNPLCGRNFEYFSEDPYLSGVMAKHWIDGVQGKGVGTSLKHFAANNQEQDRMMSDSIVDERALREIYFPAFEMAVKESRPSTVMCSYNKINGVFSSDSRKLLTEILRDEWQFEGMVVTDWGAMNDRISGFKAGCDLEMPDSSGFFDEEVKKAVDEDRLSETDIDACVERILKLAFQAQQNREKAGGNKPLNAQEHHALAKKIAKESAVLLKNEGQMLPISRGKKIALCGAMAETIRYQGAGSSHINPTKLSSMKEALEAEGAEITYYPAYELDGERNTGKLEQAVAGAREADIVIVAAGLPDTYESEGYDRAHMRMPESHNELIYQLAKENSNIVVVLMGGSPVEMPWLSEAKAILNMYLCGQAAGEAAADLLYGNANPCGKLAETWPVAYADCSSSETFGIHPRQVEYAESIYVGYRYYEKAGIPVQFPFGYGLSYTTFVLSDLKASKDTLDFTNREETVEVRCKVRNTGMRAGAEVVQIYVADQTAGVFKAKKELKGFCKVFLQAGEETEISVTLNKRAFAHYDVNSGKWEVLSGNYRIMAGASSADNALSAELPVQGTVDDMGYRDLPEWYRKPDGKPSATDFEKIYGQEMKPFELEKPGSFTMMNTLGDMKENPTVQQVIKGMTGGMLAAYGGDEHNPDYLFAVNIVLNTPLRRLVQQGGGTTPVQLMEAVVDAANGDATALASMLPQ